MNNLNKVVLRAMAGMALWMNPRPIMHTYTPITGRAQTTLSKKERRHRDRRNKLAAASRRRNRGA